MNERLIGTVPRLPGMFRRLPGLDGTLPAERLMALRMIVGLVVLLDLVTTYIPHLSTWQAVMIDDPFGARLQWPHWRWSLTRLVGIEATLAIGVLGSIGMIVGLWNRLSTLFTFIAMVSLTNDDPMTTNGGDLMRSSVLLILLVCPSIRRRQSETGERIIVPSWFATILLLQLSCLYFMNGFYKVQSPAWRNGSVMAGILSDWNWSMVAGIAHLIPDWASRAMAISTLAWELTFPIVLFVPRIRSSWLWLGLFFHVGTIFTLVVGFFPIYSLCLYIPFVPWERIMRWRVGSPRAVHPIDLAEQPVSPGPRGHLSLAP